MASAYEVGDIVVDLRIVDRRLTLTSQNSGVQQLSNDLRLTKVWSLNFDQKLITGAKFRNRKPLAFSLENQLIQWQTQSFPNVLINKSADSIARSFLVGEDEFFVLFQDASVLKLSATKEAATIIPPTGNLICFHSSDEFIAFATQIDDHFSCVIFHPASVPESFALPERPLAIWLSGAHQTLVVKFQSTLQFFQVQSGALHLVRSHDISPSLAGCITPSNTLLTIDQNILSKWSLNFAEKQASSSKLSLPSNIDRIICLSNERHCVVQTGERLMRLEIPQSSFSDDIAQVIANAGLDSVPDYAPFVQNKNWSGLKEFLISCQNPGKMDLTKLCGCLIENNQKPVLVSFLSECQALQEEDVVELLNYALPKALDRIYIPLLSRKWTRSFLLHALPGLSKANLHTLLDVLLRDRDQIGVERVVWWLTCATDTLGLQIKESMLTRVEEYLDEMHSQLKRINALRSKILDIAHPRKKQKITHYYVEDMVL